MIDVSPSFGGNNKFPAKEGFYVIVTDSKFCQEKYIVWQFMKRE